MRPRAGREKNAHLFFFVSRELTHHAHHRRGGFSRESQVAVVRRNNTGAKTEQRKTYAAPRPSQRRPRERMTIQRDASRADSQKKIALLLCTTSRNDLYPPRPSFPRVASVPSGWRTTRSSPIRPSTPPTPTTPPPLNSSRDYAVATPSMGSSVNTHSFPRLYTAMHLLPTRQVAVMMGVGSYRYRSGYAAMSASVASFA